MDEDDFLPLVKKYSQTRKQTSKTKNKRQRSKECEKKSQKSKSETKTISNCVESNSECDIILLNSSEVSVKSEIKSDTDLSQSTEIDVKLQCDINLISSAPNKVHSDGVSEILQENNSETLRNNCNISSVSNNVTKSDVSVNESEHVTNSRDNVIKNLSENDIKSENFKNFREIVIKSKDFKSSNEPLSKSEQSKHSSEQVIKSEYSMDSSEQGSSKQVTACPLCWKKFDKGHLPVAHLKACATKHGVNTQTLLNALELQKKQVAEREALGLPEFTVSKKPTGNKKNLGGVKDANLQLALALSASLQEAEEKEEDQILEVGLIDGMADEKMENVVVQKQKKLLEQFGFTSSKPALPSSVKSKTAVLNKLKNRVPPLLSRSAEERERLITEKVAIILMGEDDSQGQGSVSSFTFRETENIAEVPCIPTTKTLKKYSNQESSLWCISSIGSEGESRVPYYVQELSGNITPSEVEPGSKLRHLSQVHDYCTVPKSSAENIQPLLGTFENSKDAVNDTDLLIQNTPTCSTMTTLMKYEDERTVPQCEIVSDSLKALVKDWKSLVNKQSMSDVTIYIKDEKEVYAHKLVFYVRCSAILVDLIKQEDQRSGRIHEMLMWSEFSRQPVLAFLEYIYCGDMSRLMHLSDGIDELKQLAKRYSVHEILQHIDVMNGAHTSVSDTSARNQNDCKLSNCDSSRAVKLGNVSSSDSSHAVTLGNVSSSDSSHAVNLGNVLRNSLNKDESIKLCDYFSLTKTPNSQQVNSSKDIMMSQSSPDPFTDSVIEHVDEDLTSSQESRKSIDVLLSLMSKSQLTQSFNTPSRDLKLSNITSDSDKKDVLLSSANKLELTQSLSRKLACDDFLPECISVDEDVLILENKLDVEQSFPSSSKGLKQTKVFSASSSHNEHVTLNLESEPQFCVSFNSPSKEIKHNKVSPGNKGKLVSDSKESVRSRHSDSDSIMSPLTFSNIERAKRKCNSQVNSSSKKLCFDIQECEVTCESLVKKSHVITLDLTHSDSEEEVINKSQNRSLTERSSKVVTPDKNKAAELGNRSCSASKVISSSCQDNFDTAATSNSYISDVWEDFEEVAVIYDIPYQLTPKSVSKRFSFTHTSLNTPTKSPKHLESPKSTPSKSPKHLESPKSIPSKSPKHLDSPKSTPSKSPKHLDSPKTSPVKYQHLESPKSTPVKSQKLLDSFKFTPPSQKSILSVRHSLHHSQEKENLLQLPEDVEEISSDSSKHEGDSPEMLRSPVESDQADNYRQLLDDSFATNFDSYSLSLLEGTSGFSKSVSKRKKYSTPPTRSAASDQSPGVLVSDKVTPRPEYTTMKTPQLEKELNRFGIKNLRKNQAKKLLRHIYNELHPLVPAHNEDKSDGGFPFKEPGMNVRAPRSPKKKPTESPPKRTFRRNLLTGSQTRTSKPEDNSASDCEDLPSSQDSSHSSSGNSIIAEEMVLEELCTDTQATVEDNPDFRSAVRSYIIKNPELYKQILRYEPIWLEELQKNLKAQKLKFNTNQLLDFLDEQCITFRTGQGQRSRSRRKGSRKVTNKTKGTKR